MTPTAPECDVAVVGYGPTGNALAILLAQLGHSVVVVERRPKPYPLPRAVHFDHEVARVLQACGIGPQLAEISEAAEVYEWRNAAGATLLRFGRVGVGPSGWPESSMFNQPALEARLDERAHELPLIRVLRGVEVTALEQDSDIVTLSGTDGAGRTVEVRSRFAVGCDGANSRVRDLIDVPVTDLGFFFDWLIIDVVLHETRVFDPINLQICDPARPTTAVSGGPGRRRWEFMRLPHEHLDDLDDERVAWERLAPWDVSPANATLERHAVYTFNARYAEQWRRGRVLLAGDAAHLMPPFAGQGMCSGIRDAANLAWKLDLVLRGGAPDALLDSYTEERMPHARRVIDFSTALGKIICVPDPDEAAARDAAMTAGVTDELAEVPPLPKLEGGLFDPDDDLAGWLFPQGTVMAGERRGRFDDLTGGYGWRLVTVDRAPLVLEPSLGRWFDGLGGTVLAVGPGGDLDDVDGTYARWFDRQGVSWVLQRPDFHVHGTASSAARAATLLSNLRDQLALAPRHPLTTRITTVKIANANDRAVLVLGDEIADLAKVSDGRFGPDPMSPFSDWPAFLEVAGSVTTGTGPLVEADLRCPVPQPRQVFAIGLNYRSHAEESGMAVPDVPATFTKFPASLSGPFDDIEIPNGMIDWEVELVVVIGRRSDRVAEADAWSHVAGLTVGQDISDRGLQFAAGAQFSLGKSRRGYGPLGPWVVTLDELADPDDLGLGCSVDGETVQDARTSDLIFAVPQLVAELSAVLPLLPGDIIFTGTPAGVGFTRQPSRSLQPGQVLESWIEGIGTIRNRCV